MTGLELRFLPKESSGLSLSDGRPAGLDANSLKAPRNFVEVRMAMEGILPLLRSAVSKRPLTAAWAIPTILWILGAILTISQLAKDTSKDVLSLGVLALIVVLLIGYWSYVILVLFYYRRYLRVWGYLWRGWLLFLSSFWSVGIVGGLLAQAHQLFGLVSLPLFVVAPLLIGRVALRCVLLRPPGGA